MAARRSEQDLEDVTESATRDEVRAKLSHFVRSRWFEPPFGGARFTGMLLDALAAMARSEEHTSELQSLMRISYAVFCLKKKKTNTKKQNRHTENNKEAST